MIVVDANYIRRFLVASDLQSDIAMATKANHLFELAAAGIETLFISDAVIAEVVYILASKRHYNLSRNSIVVALTPILRFDQCTFHNKNSVQRALELWANNSRISFVDAIGAALAIEFDSSIATFDRELVTVAGSRLWHPES